jgi:hypothetical protein
MQLHRSLPRIAAALVAGALLCASVSVASVSAPSQDESVPGGDDCRPGEAEGWIAERAVSLRQLQSDLAGCQETGCPADLLELRGLGRVDGFVVDKAHADIVLFGPARRADDPIQHTDDLVEGLRSASYRYAEQVKGNTRYFNAPGVTLNPRPEVVAALRRISAGGAAGDEGWTDRFCETCHAPMDLVVYGIPADATAAATMARADLVLKSITNSDLPVPGFESLAAMRREAALDEMRAGAVKSVSTMTRLWFYPNMVSYLEQADGIALNRVDVGIQQEPQVVMADGRHRDGGRPDPVAAKWACKASRMYREIAAAVPDSGWEPLSRLMRVFGVAKLIADRHAAEESGLDLGYLLDRHVLAHIPLKREWDGVAHVERVEWQTVTKRSVTTWIAVLPSCGGVDMALGRDNFRPVKDMARAIAPAMGRIVASRPAPAAPMWTVRD